MNNAIPDQFGTRSKSVIRVSTAKPDPLPFTVESLFHTVVFRVRFQFSVFQFSNGSLSCRMPESVRKFYDNVALNLPGYGSDFYPPCSNNE